MKSYTDISQSRVLAKFLPLESADMYYDDIIDSVTGELFIPDDGSTIKIGKGLGGSIAAWSLAALLDIIPKHIKEYNVLRTDIDEKGFSLWYDEVGYGVNDRLPDITMECPVDACVEMILKLKELKLI